MKKSDFTLKCEKTIRGDRIKFSKFDDFSLAQIFSKPKPKGPRHSVEPDSSDKILSRIHDIA